MATGAVFDLDDPRVGVEANLALEPLFDFFLRHRVRTERPGKRPLTRMRLIERRLRGGGKQFGGTVEAVKLHENRSGIFGTTSAHGRERSFYMAAAHVSGDPDRRFQPHCGYPLRAGRVAGNDTNMRRRMDQGECRGETRLMEAGALTPVH